MMPLEAIAREHGLAIVEDCCQAHLATETGRPVGTIGVAGAFSFYPTKNLGALGDGGAVVTNDPDLAARLKRLRNGGQIDRYHHQEFGVNSRLDDLQAAVLRARLPVAAALDRAPAGARRPLSCGACQQLGAGAGRARRRTRLPPVRRAKLGAGRTAGATWHRTASTRSFTIPFPFHGSPPSRRRSAG